MLKLYTGSVVFAMKAREAVEMRAQIEKKLAQKEKEKREENLRQLAQKAREERAGIRRADGMLASVMLLTYMYTYMYINYLSQKLIQLQSYLMLSVFVYLCNNFSRPCLLYC